MDATPDSIRERLVAALPQALKERDTLAVDALRSALAAIENAAAVDAPPATDAPAVADATTATGTISAHVAGSTAGVGASEAPRRELTESDLLAIVVAEADERETEAATYRDLGRADAANRLVAQAAYLREFTV